MAYHTLASIEEDYAPRDPVEERIEECIENHLLGRLAIRNYRQLIDTGVYTESRALGLIGDAFTTLTDDWAGLLTLRQELQAAEATQPPTIKLVG